MSQRRQYLPMLECIDLLGINWETCLHVTTCAGPASHNIGRPAPASQDHWMRPQYTLANLQRPNSLQLQKPLALFSKTKHVRTPPAKNIFVRWVRHCVVSTLDQQLLVPNAMPRNSRHRPLTNIPATHCTQALGRRACNRPGIIETCGNHKCLHPTSVVWLSCCPEESERTVQTF